MMMEMEMLREGEASRRSASIALASISKANGLVTVCSERMLRSDLFHNHHHHHRKANLDNTSPSPPPPPSPPHIPTREMVSPTTIKSLIRELTSLSRSPPADIRVSLSETDILSFQAYILGPHSTPYSGGYFRILFDFTDVDFPTHPPRCTFSTPIFHPNVSRTGEICVSSLKKDWKKEYGIERILTTIKCLLIEPNPDSALDAEASRLMQEDWDEYVETARLWTSVHANARPACFQVTEQQDTPEPLKVLPSNCSTSALPTAATAPVKSTSTRTPVTTAPKRGLRRL
ncbi:ubiquitin-conjugating enzyme E2 [Pseudozyma hubeiensis SY62]|uniref:E2 ubiquitin-conjugating enzyme n=1 Tax=Pseudozyma hubeiensis (strain SY62) TaxID=1305764 RepID=R9PK96_PSEHS|nr:ubiquitin-conjugating enzyme E2 [Pseudozyma hubeiensis SY62]GAC98540.1 ubiquitin-conjugating enzyme E2 [Pseudozyma hubeiensis SY62]